MPYSSPSTQATGQVGTAAYANSLKAATDYLANPPACRVYNSSAISIPNSADTAITFNSERYDTDTMHSTSTNTSRITFNTAGLYLITGAIEWATTGAYAAGLKILVTGVGTIANLTGESGAPLSRMTVASVCKCAAASYAELVVVQFSGGSVNINAASAYSPEFSATWIGLG